MLGKHSGRHAVAKRAATLGYPLHGDQLNDCLVRFKRRADEIGEINDAELLAMVEASRPPAAGGPPEPEEHAYAAVG